MPQDLRRSGSDIPHPSMGRLGEEKNEKSYLISEILVSGIFFKKILVKFPKTDYGRKNEFGTIKVSKKMEGEIKRES